VNGGNILRSLITFAEFLRSQRLALAYRILSDTRFAERSVSSIAYEAGFGDLSNFNHYPPALWRDAIGSSESPITPARFQSRMTALFAALHFVA
jgi:AraC-like DNA-binding protein